MRTELGFVLLVALAPLGQASKYLASRNSIDEGSDVLEQKPKQYIIEFSSSAHLRTKRDELASNSDVQVLQTFDSPIFSGASVETENESVESLQSMGDVVAVWPNNQVNLLAPVKRQTAVDQNSSDAYDVHWATGVKELHENGILGKGVKVGVVDTGVWYNHSALGGGFGPGFKVAGGWDFSGDGSSGSGKQPDADPIDQQGHGTHVSGILAGSAENGWKGVAPEATLYAYKVFGSEDGTDTSTIIEAFLRAYEDGMDVITASIGGRGGFATNAWAVVADRIARQGVVITIAAGNSGAGGPYYASSGSSGESVVAVASAHVQKSTQTIKPSYFTSWGGLYDLSCKPDISAPGTDIFSTWIGESNDQFTLLSGTSMAAPYVAGIAALWISANGGKGANGVDIARTLGMRIMSSGSPMHWLNYDRSVNDGFFAPSHQIGSGLVDAGKVLNSTISLGMTRWGLNDTANLKETQSILLKNVGTEKVRYTFESESWAGFDMLAPYDPTQSTETPRLKYAFDMVSREITAKVSLPDSFELGPGEEKEAKFLFNSPQGLNETALPAYSGRIIINSSNGDNAAVPYQGVAFDLNEQMQNIYAGTYPWLRSTASYSNKTDFTMDLSLGAQDFPKLFAKLNWGTKELRWDIYETDFDENTDWEYPPVVGRRSYVGSVASWVQASQLEFDPSKHDKDDTNSFPLVDQARNAMVSGGYTSNWWWFGKLANGTYVGSGNYTMRFSALIPFADPTDVNGWSTKTWNVSISLAKNSTTIPR